MKRGGKKRIDQNLVFDMFSNQNKTAEQIAIELGCTRVNVSWILRTKFGLDRQNKSLCPWVSKKEHSIIGVYCLLNTITEKFYIGSSQNIFKRIARSHYTLLKNGNGITKELQKDFDKYGESSFVCEIYAKCESIHEALNIEYSVLNDMSIRDMLYNKTYDIFDIKNVLTEGYISKFRSLVDKTDTCWNFKGHINKDGYGELNLTYGKSRKVMAHRFSYELHKGSCGRELVGHKCNNKKCVNPEHLYLTNHVDNMNYFQQSKSQEN